MKGQGDRWRVKLAAAIGQAHDTFWTALLASRRRWQPQSCRAWREQSWLLLQHSSHLLLRCLQTECFKLVDVVLACNLTLPVRSRAAKHCVQIKQP